MDLLSRIAAGSLPGSLMQTGDSDMSSQPFVSIVIPCRNESRFIRGCLESIVNNDYPADRFEVLVVDGMSTDDTRAILSEYRRAHSSIRTVDNPKRVTPS